jgi:hypothetical protein
MGWEKRKGRLFYYRKARDEHGRVQSQYLGRGEQALEASRADGVAVPDEALTVAQPEVTNIRHVKKEEVADIRHVKKESADTDDSPIPEWLNPEWLRRARGY